MGNVSNDSRRRRHRLRRIIAANIMKTNSAHRADSGAAVNWTRWHLAESSASPHGRLTVAVEFCTGFGCHIRPARRARQSRRNGKSAAAGISSARSRRHACSMDARAIQITLDKQQTFFLLKLTYYIINSCQLTCHHNRYEFTNNYRIERIVTFI